MATEEMKAALMNFMLSSDSLQIINYLTDVTGLIEILVRDQVIPFSGGCYIIIQALASTIDSSKKMI
jgi:hypothetical protein